MRRLPPNALWSVWLDFADHNYRCIAWFSVAVYQYKPSVFDSFMKKKVAPVPVTVKPADTQTKLLKTDTNAKDKCPAVGPCSDSNTTAC